VSIHELRNRAGVVTSFRAVAGKVLGKQARASFNVKRHGSEAKALAEAKKWEKRKRIELETDRHAIIEIPDSIRPEIIECLELLEPHGLRIVDAVRGYLRLLAIETRDPWTFRQAASAFIESRRDKGARPEYLRSLDDNLGLACKTFGEQLCDDITTEAIEAWLRSRGRKIRDSVKGIIGRKPLSPITWRNYRRDMGMVFRFAIDRKRASQNPAKALPEPDRSDAAVQILTTAQVKHLLEASEPTAQVYIALMAFCGVRPFEMLQLSENSIDFQRQILEIHGRHSKSRSRRLVTIPPNLVTWLEKGVEHLGKARDYWRFRSMLTESATRAGVALVQDVLRHSFGSHHLAFHRSASLTAHEMGNSEAMVFSNYRELVTHEEGKAYFEIRPPDTPT
jgi:integrase